jgi:hypothetical protein
MSSRHANHEAWVARAGSVRIEDEVIQRGIKPRTQCVVGPCPHCGRDDRFAINTKGQVFNCRACGARGDVIALVDCFDGCNFKAVPVTDVLQQGETTFNKRRSSIAESKL